MDLTRVDRELAQLATIPIPTRPSVDELVARARRRHRRRATAEALAGTVLVTLIGVGAFALAGDDATRLTTDGPRTAEAPVAGEETVPDVVGSAVGRARRTLRDAGLVLSVSPGSPAVDGAVIVASEPGAGSDVPQGAIVGVRTALPDPPVDVECPTARHPRGASGADALPEVNSISRLAAEDGLSTWGIELRQRAVDSGRSEPVEMYLGIWDRWAYSGSGASVSVVPAKGFQIIVVLGDASECPSAPEVRGVPVTYVVAPIEDWAGSEGPEGQAPLTSTTAGTGSLLGLRLSFDGLGPIEIGMTIEEAERVTSASIIEVQDLGAGCAEYRALEGPEVVFMVVDGRILIIQVSGPVVTDAGLGVGATEDEIIAAYQGDRVDGRKNRLAIREVGVRPSDPASEFETIFSFDAAGKGIESIRTGPYPEVEQYDEGCA